MQIGQAPPPAGALDELAGAPPAPGIVVYLRARKEASPAREGPFINYEKIILIWPRL